MSLSTHVSALALADVFLDRLGTLSSSNGEIGDQPAS